MAELVLKANRRLVVGKGVKNLRRQNITPLHLFGHGVESLALQSDTPNVQRILRLAGETKLISLTVDDERRPRPVLISKVEKDALSGRLLHVDLHQVQMTEKVTVEVPIVLVGDARALLVKGSTLLQQLDYLTVESLPDKIPENVRLDIAPLEEPGQAVKVKDIEVGPGVVVVNDAEQIVAVVVAKPEEKPAQAAVTAEEPAATAESEQPTAETQTP